MTDKNKGFLLVLGTAIISGFSIFINKYGVSVSNPYIFTFLKNSLVAILLCSAVLFVREWPKIKALTKKQWLLLLSIGLVGGSIPFLLFFKGLSISTPATASFIQKTMFVWIFILAIIFLKEKITRLHLISGLIILCANIFLLKLSDFHFNQGSGLVFLATLFWAVENIISKYALKELPPKIVMWGRMFFGSFFILFFLIATGQASTLTQINLQQIGWTMITGIILFGYVATYYTGLKYIQVSEAAIILMLGSPITTLLASVFIKPAPVKEYFAGILMILGVLLIIGADKLMTIVKKTYVRS